MRGLATIVGLTIALAGLDLVESVLAKEWSVRRNPWLLVAGIAASLSLFGLFVLAIRHAHMSTVTLGWIVTMQAGLMLIERFRYEVHHSADRWVAVSLMLVLQAYLLTSRSTSAV